MAPSVENLTHHLATLQYYVSRIERPSGAVNLESAETRGPQLPNDLLVVAKSEPSLSAAVADIVGAGHRVFNHYTASPLNEWVAALAPFVRVVSWNGDHTTPKGGLQYAIKLFDALSAESVHLQLLDLRTLNFESYKKREKLSISFFRMLQRNAESLKGLGIQLCLECPLWPLAIQNLSLPNLQVVEIGYIPNLSECLPKPGAFAKAVIEFLAALGSHADSTKKKTTLHELRILEMKEVPCTSHVESCAGLFSAVKVLKLTPSKVWPTERGATAKFIALFGNLETLHWKCVDVYEGGELDNVHLIHDACRRLEEVHLDYWFVSHNSTPISAMPRFGEVFEAFYGKLRSLTINMEMTRDEIRALGIANPQLYSLDMHLGRSNVCALPLLLGTHCRKLRSLTTCSSGNVKNSFYEHNWRTLGEAVKSASNALCEISIGGPVPCLESEVEPMERCLTEILKCIGGRAGKISFLLPVELEDARARTELWCRVMRTVGDHANDLESLSLSFEHGLYMWDHDSIGVLKFDGAEEEKKSWKQLLKEKQQMMAVLLRLKSCNLGCIDEVAEERLAKIEAGM